MFTTERFTFDMKFWGNLGNEKEDLPFNRPLTILTFAIHMKNWQSFLYKKSIFCTVYMHAVNFLLLNPKEICTTVRRFSYLKAECSFQNKFQRVREHYPLLRVRLPYFTHTFFWQITTYKIRSLLIGQSKPNTYRVLSGVTAKTWKLTKRARLILLLKMKSFVLRMTLCQFDFE